MRPATQFFLRRNCESAGNIRLRRNSSDRGSKAQSVVSGLETPRSLLQDDEMRCPIVEQHLQTSSPPGSRGIPPPFIGRPRSRPAHDPQGRATGDRQDQDGRNSRAPPSSGHPDCCPVRAQDLDRDRHRMDERWRRRREVAWPWCRVPGTFRDSGPAPGAHAPRCPLTASAQANCLGTGGSGATFPLGLLTPGYEADLLARPPPARANSS